MMITRHWNAIARPVNIHFPSMMNCPAMQDVRICSQLPIATAVTYSLAVIGVFAAMNGITPFGTAGTMQAITTMN